MGDSIIYQDKGKGNNFVVGFRGTAYLIDTTDKTFELYSIVTERHEKTIKKGSEDALLIQYDDKKAPDWFKNTLN